MMSHSPLVPLNDLYLARCRRTRQAMVESNVPVMLILDSINILYITGASNMTFFSTRVPARYLLIFAEGPTVLFEYFGCEHLAEGLPTIDRIQTARGLCYTSSGGRVSDSCKAFANEIRDIIKEHSGIENRLAVDRFPFVAIDALRASGLVLSDADIVLSSARRTKLKSEVDYLKEALKRVEAATARFEEAIEPGKRESEIWAKFHEGLIGEGGQYVTTRLMQSGSNTYPYFKECSDRVLEPGDLVCLDTDALGYQGYAVDYSRTFLCGERKATPVQHLLYARAREQLEHNASLIQSGASYQEIAERAWKVPEEHQDSRYYCIGHGLGMSGEYPNIPPAVDGETYPLSGVVEPGMVLCIESYIGSKNSGQGVKLEQQLLVTDTGTECMSNYKFDSRLGQ
ncbi:MAG: M24 family metallopeptidase [bacterium]